MTSWPTRPAIGRLTSGVPVDVRDEAGGALTDAHPLAAQHVVDVHERVVGRHRQVLPRVWTQGETLSPALSPTLSPALSQTLSYIVSDKLSYTLSYIFQPESV